MILPNSAGVVPTTSTPMAAMRSWKPVVLMVFMISRCSVSMISGGVCAGPTRPTPEPTSKPGKPDSDIVGTSGKDEMRFRLVAAIARRPPSRINGSSELICHEHVDPAGEEIRDHDGRTAERDMDEVDTGMHLEQLTAEMLRRTNPDRSERQLGRRGFRKRDELLHCAGWQRRRAPPARTARRRPG